jgi:hypothetical protein
MRRHHVEPNAEKEPDDGHDAPKSHSPPYGCFEESKTHQGTGKFDGLIVGIGEAVKGFQPFGPAHTPTSVQGVHGRLFFVSQCLISVAAPVMRVGILR